MNRPRPAHFDAVSLALSRLPQANVILKARAGGFTTLALSAGPGVVLAAVASPAKAEAVLTTGTSPVKAEAVLTTGTSPGDSGAVTNGAFPANFTGAPTAATALISSGAALPPGTAQADSRTASRSGAASVDPGALVRPVELEPFAAPAEPIADAPVSDDPLTAPRSTEPAATTAPPAEPAPAEVPPSVVPVSPAPVPPAPGHPVPIAPVPGHPVPESPVSPAPVGPGLDGDDLPDAESISAEISAELAAQVPPAAQPASSQPDPADWRGVVLVTGTDTEVGKTVVTAAVAAAAQAAGLRVAVIKPGQTGIATGAPTDIAEITRLAGPDTTRTLAEYPEPLAPLAAATVASMPPLELDDVVDAIRAEADKHDLVLVEGAGGLLVPMGVRPSGESWTVADLAVTLGISAIVVARAGLGTLNHTALTLEALSRRGVPAGVIIGAWPAEPELVHWANLGELVPHLIGALPSGAGRMDPGVFRRSAPGWLTPALYGVLDNWRVWAEEYGDGHH